MAEDDWIDPDIRFGNPHEWVDFGERNRRVLEVLPALVGGLRAAFSRQMKDVPRHDLVIFFTGYRCAEDYLEILLMCGNGEGYGAQKLLRAMFEHAVLTKYLHQHPDQIESYWNYRHVTAFKHANALSRFWGAEAMSDERLAEFKAEADAVKGNYRHRECSKCGTREAGAGWSKVALPDMAEEVGLGNLVPAAYYEPLLDSHPSLSGMARRLNVEEFLAGAPLMWGDRVGRDLSDRVLATAHLLVIDALDVQRDHFKLAPEPFATLADDWASCWKDRPQSRPMPVGAS